MQELRVIMADYTRKQLKERWEKAKTNLDDFGALSAVMLRDHIIPGLWEVRLFPRWLFKYFLDRKIIEPPGCAIMSRNVSYDPDSEDTQEWGWYKWRYYFDREEDCYVLELNYNVKTGDTKPLPLVRGILDVCLLESKDSMIGKFKWRIRWLQRVPLLRRIPPIFLFYFEMKKIGEPKLYISLSAAVQSDPSIEDIKFPKGSDSWGKVKFGVLFDPKHRRSMWLSLDD